MKLPKELTTVTPLSKTLALILTILLPLLGFYIGVQFKMQMKSIHDAYDPPHAVQTQPYQVSQP